MKICLQCNWPCHPTFDKSNMAKHTYTAYSYSVQCAQCIGASAAALGCNGSNNINTQQQQSTVSNSKRQQQSRRTRCVSASHVTMSHMLLVACHTTAFHSNTNTAQPSFQSENISCSPIAAQHIRFAGSISETLGARGLGRRPRAAVRAPCSEPLGKANEGEPNWKLASVCGRHAHTGCVCCLSRRRTAYGEQYATTDTRCVRLLSTRSVFSDWKARSTAQHGGMQSLASSYHIHYPPAMHESVGRAIRTDTVITVNESSSHKNKKKIIFVLSIYRSFGRTIIFNLFQCKKILSVHISWVCWKRQTKQNLDSFVNELITTFLFLLSTTFFWNNKLPFFDDRYFSIVNQVQSKVNDSVLHSRLRQSKRNLQQSWALDKWLV